MPTVTFGQHLDFLSTVAALNVLHETLPPSDSEEKETPTIALNLLSNSFIPLWIFGLLAFLPP